MRIAWVAPSMVKIRLQRVQVAVRWAANQCGIVRSPSTLPLPSLVISSPMPTMRPRMSTQATTTPAATRPEWPADGRPGAGSPPASLRSVRASGSSPSVTGSVTGWPAALRVSSKASVVTPSQVMPIVHAPGVGQVMHAEQDPTDPDQATSVDAR